MSNTGSPLPSRSSHPRVYLFHLRGKPSPAPETYNHKPLWEEVGRKWGGNVCPISDLYHRDQLNDSWWDLGVRELPRRLGQLTFPSSQASPNQEEPGQPSVLKQDGQWVGTVGLGSGSNSAINWTQVRSKHMMLKGGEPSKDQ